MIEPKKIRKGDVVATKHQSIIVERSATRERLSVTAAAVSAWKERTEASSSSMTETRW